MRPDREKVLFLDCDGVLNHRRWLFAAQRLMDKEYFPTRGAWNSPEAQVRDVDPSCLAMIRHVINETDCCLVMSTTWRRGIDYPCSYFRDIFAMSGWKKSPVIGVTPVINSDVRGAEIKQYLESSGRNVKRYAIVDDDSDMLEEQLPFFVQTNGKEGITIDDAERLIRILND